MKTFKQYSPIIIFWFILIFGTILLTACAENPQAGGDRFGGGADSKPNIHGGVIAVSITNVNGIKLYSENLPLINVMQLREVYTDNEAPFTFNFDVPDGWSITFISEIISFSCIKSGIIELNFEVNSYYQFSITTQN